MVVQKCVFLPLLTPHASFRGWSLLLCPLALEAAVPFLGQWNVGGPAVPNVYFILFLLFYLKKKTFPVSIIIFLFLCRLRHVHHPKTNCHPSLHTCASSPLSPSSLPPSPLVTTNPVSAAMCFVWRCLCLLLTSEIIWYLTFSVLLISLSVIPSRSIHIFTNGWTLRVLR